MTSEAPNMHFVNDRPRRRSVERRITFPIVRVGINHYVLHRAGSVVFLPSTCGVAVVRCRYGYASAVRIEENLRRVEAQAVVRIPRTFDTIAVDLTWLQIRHKDMPVIERAVGERVEMDYTCRVAIILTVKQ